MKTAMKFGNMTFELYLLGGPERTQLTTIRFLSCMSSDVSLHIT